MRSHEQLRRGKIQAPWQWTQTATSPNKLHTRKRLCASEKQGALLTASSVKRSPDTCEGNVSEWEWELNGITECHVHREWGQCLIWRDAMFLSYVGFNIFLFELLNSARQEGGGRTR